MGTINNYIKYLYLYIKIYNIIYYDLCHAPATHPLSLAKRRNIF